MEPVGIGLIGCGTISGAYLRAAATFDVLKFVACADIDPTAAKRTEDTFGVPAMPVDALLARDDVDVVLNLTIPAAHGEVNLAALAAGKHAYCEKPFGLDVAEGRRVLAAAAAAGLRVGCAPDTFLGGGHQTVRQLIDRGAVGKPIAGTAFMMGPGVESWHPNPAFYYQRGGGPLFDMGPYYLTALVHVLGPVRRVAAITARGRDQRVITAEARAGEIIDVDVDTHTAGTLEFVNGCVVTVVMSFDVRLHSNRFIEIHGVDASLSSPDPNGFGGLVRVSNGREWEDRPLTHGYTTNMRSIGLADMCAGIRTGRPHRCDGELAQHVLEIMAAFGESSADGRHVSIASRPERPNPLPTGLTDGQLD
ncbi:MAG: Gfo/Idh/MocA family oxidoreductase [Gammaproteobacteria bacterium]|nr:Gfo/Idh/MocA family oxidoreductase [Gammaproteobacteria bacterium]